MVNELNFYKEIRNISHFYCPVCETEMKACYIAKTVFVCLECKNVRSLRWYKEKRSIEDIKKDGWLK